MAAANAQDVEMFEVEDFGGQVAAPEDMAPKAGTVLNNAGGLSFEVDDMTRLRRFLILGTDTANYYVDVAALAVENAMSVKRMLDAGQGLAVVAEVVIISREGRAPKQGPGIFVLAMAARLGDKATRSAALRAVALVCRTGSTLFEFVQRCKELGKVAGVGKQESAPEASEGVEGDAVEGDAGKEAKAKAVTAAGRLSWGRAMRRAIASWYLDKEPSAVAYQVTKYSQRNGWSHADLLRLAHPNPQLHAEKKAAKRAATATEQDSAAGAATAEAAPAVADAAAALEADAAAADGSEEPAASVVAVAAGGSEAEQQVRQQCVEDFKALFSFVVNGGKVLPEGAKQKAAEERRQAMLARKRKAEAEAGKAAERADASTEAAAAGATGGEVTAGETAQVAVSASKEQEETAAGPAGGASETPLSAVLQYLVDAERLRKHIRAPALPKTQEEIEAAALAKEAKAARAKAGRGRGRGRGRGIRGRVVSDDSGDEAKEGVEEQAEKEAGAVAMDVEEGEEARAARLAARAAPIEEACGLIRKHRFSHEHIGDTILLKCPEVWSTLLDVGMPMTALVRNLGRLTSLGLLADSSTSSEATAAAALAKVTGQLRSARAVQAARLHPIVLLEARKQYQQGRGDKGGLTWMPCKAVEDALEEAFYLAFKNVQPTGKRFLAGVDVSGSMGFTACTGMRTLNAREAAAAMLMSLVRCEPVLHSMAFCSEFVPLDITKDMKLDEVLHKVSSLPFGSTDCSLPMLYALEKKIPVDVFVVLTDNETYAGRMTPVEALRKYRREMGIPAQLIVMAFSVTRFTIADPTDAGMLDVAGMDSAVPQVVAEFVSGKL